MAPATRTAAGIGMLGIFSIFNSHYVHASSPEGSVYLGMYLEAYACFLADHICDLTGTEYYL